MSNEKKIGIVMLWKFNKEFFALTPEKEAELWKGWDEVYKTRWEKKVKSVCTYHAVGMGKFHGFDVSEVTDIGDWEACSEESSRYWSKYAEFEFYTGINEPYFTEATKEIPYYIKLRKKP